MAKEPSVKKLTDLFCHVNDFCEAFLPQWQKLQIETGERKRNRKSRMSESDIMTIMGFYAGTPENSVTKAKDLLI
jgi:hypothetical protein